jgi:hypothetical protein
VTWTAPRVKGCVVGFCAPVEGCPLLMSFSVFNG